MFLCLLSTQRGVPCFQCICFVKILQYKPSSPTQGMLAHSCPHNLYSCQPSPVSRGLDLCSILLILSPPVSIMLKYTPASASSSAIFLRDFASSLFGVGGTKLINILGSKLYLFCSIIQKATKFDSLIIYNIIFSYKFAWVSIEKFMEMDLISEEVHYSKKII